jgi:hypothetical protein
VRYWKSISIVVLVLLVGCASMDLRTDELRMHSDYGRVEPRIPFEEMQYYTGEPDDSDRPYTKLAEIVVQETPTVMLSRSTNEMILYMCQVAWENGADAVINVSFDTKNVAGGYARVTPVVKGTAIRYTEPNNR